MAILTTGICGFEIGEAPTGSNTTINFLNPAISNGFVTSDLSSTAARSGSYGYNSNVTVAAASHHAHINMTSAAALPGGTTAWELKVRAYFKVISFPSVSGMTLFSVWNGTSVPQTWIEMSTTGQVRLRTVFCGNSTSAYQGPLSTNTWYRIDVRIYGAGSNQPADASHTSACEVDIYADGSVVAGATFSDQVALGNNLPVNWPILIQCGQGTAEGGPSCTRTIYYDDLWWKRATDTDTGLVANPWPTATKIFRFSPTGAGSSTQFARAGVDSGANWSQVDEIPPNTGGSSDTITSATAGQTDYYTHAASSLNSDVYHIRSIAWVSDTTTPQTLIIDSVENDITTGTARYGVADKAYTNAAPLTRTAFDALQIGVKKKSGATTFTVQNVLWEVLGVEPDIYGTGGGPSGTSTFGEDSTGGIKIGGTNATFTPDGGTDTNADGDTDDTGDLEDLAPLVLGGLYPGLKIVLQTDETQETGEGIRRGWTIANGKISRAYAACLYSENIDDNNSRSLVLKPLIGVSSDDGYALLCDTGSDDNGTPYKASMTTKSIIPRGLASKFGVTDIFLLASPHSTADVEVKLTRDFGKETISRTTDLAATGSETQVIKRLDSLEISEATAVKLEIEDVDTPTGNWELNRLDVIIRAEEDQS